jgi:exopolysaccharide biosynthesis WecB/TagA/CpsF family protein
VINVNFECEGQLPKVRDILGLPIAMLNKVGATLLLREAFLNQKALRLAFVNANLANMSKADQNLNLSLQSFLLLNDGSGMAIASNLLYKEAFPDNLNGTDFIPYFLNSCDLELSVFLLGGSPEVSALTKDAFQKKWPQHKVVGVQHGYFGESKSIEVLADIKMLKPNLVLVAMGNGLQEFWVSRIVPNAAMSAWGVGAFFDFLCNNVPRAPSWMRMLGVEWMYRLYLEPKRLWKRYLIGNFKFIFYVLSQKITKK